MEKKQLNVKKTSMYSYLFKRDTLFATILVFLVFGLFVKLEKGLGIFDPKDVTSKDFDYNDLAFNLLSKYNSHPLDTGICIVNIGNADIKSVVNIISKVSQAQPKVIGIDVLFGLIDTPRKQDIALRNILQGDKKIIMAYQLDSTVTRPTDYFLDKSVTAGFVNFTLNDQNVIRQFMPYRPSKDTLLSFAAACVKLADPLRYKELISRDHRIETINYTRPEEKFLVINGDQTDFSRVKGKIVLIGAIDSGFDYEDKHFTPLNTTLTGKSWPDMSGIVIHANIIRMILDKNYIHESPWWLNWIIAFFICWLHMAFFISYFIEKHMWFHIASKVIQLITAVVTIYFSLFLFYDCNIQVDMTQSVVAIILAVDVLYFYEAGVVWLHQKKGFKTLFHHDFAN